MYNTVNKMDLSKSIACKGLLQTVILIVTFERRAMIPMTRASRHITPLENCSSKTRVILTSCKTFKKDTS